MLQYRNPSSYWDSHYFTRKAGFIFFEKLCFKQVSKEGTIQSCSQTFWKKNKANPMKQNSKKGSTAIHRIMLSFIHKMLLEKFVFSLVKMFYWSFFKILWKKEIENKRNTPLLLDCLFENITQLLKKCLN